MYLNSFKYQRRFLILPGVRYLFLDRFNSYGGSSKILLPSFIISIYSLFQFYRRIVEDLSQVCAISLLILSTRVSSMPNPLLVINLNWWRICITQFLLWFHPSDLVSSFQSCSSCHISRFERLHLFLFRSSKLSALSRRKAPPKSLQGFTLCCQLLFLSIILLFTGVLHGGSTWCFAKDSFHSSIVLQDFPRS